MPDLRALPVLAGRSPLAAPGIRLSPLPEGTVLQVIAGPDAPDQTARVEKLGAEAGLVSRPLSPGQWLLVGDRPTGHAELRTLLAAFEPQASGIDQSHGRVRICLEGRMATTALSRGTAVDLDPTAFPVGHATMTLIGHISAHLTRLDADRFEITVLRGFAEALWDDLVRMCAAFD